MKSECNLTIRNLGVIDEADIDITKINVVGGVNSSGKSTISKILYCFLKSQGSPEKLLENEGFRNLNLDNIKFKSDSKFRDIFYNFQKNYRIHAKIAFEAYTKLKGYGFKAHDDFYVAKIGESRIICGFTERGNVTRLLMYEEDD